MAVSRKSYLWMGLSLVLALTLAAIVGRPVVHLLRTSSSDSERRPELAPGFVDDASRMNATAVAEVFDVPATMEAAEQQLAALLRRAQEEGLRVSIAGARHSMGGHTLNPGGLVVNMLPFSSMELDESTNLLRVQAGAKWSEIIPYLDGHGRSVAVMQSNDSFSVGGSLSVNCHGWQHDRSPIASTVDSFRLMKADGSIVRCSRNENAELFSLALGGYGLFGIILEAELRVVPNERLKLQQFLVPLENALDTFDQQVNAKSNVSMVYARLNIVPDKLFQSVILSVLRSEPGGSIPELSESRFVGLRRALFRGTVASDYGKELRWNAETEVQPRLINEIFSRNQLLNQGVEIYENRSSDSVDILHEYFVPRSKFVQFIEELRKIVLDHEGDLLNVTVRNVNEDSDTYLRYADQQMFALVMLFNQPRTSAGDSKMEAMTQDIIEAALSVGGRYYLPYRLHATLDQFHRAYPQAREFFELKRRYDPDEVFVNRFYEKYAANHAP